MTAAAPLTVCGAEVFSAGESFSDGTGSIPAILTEKEISRLKRMSRINSCGIYIMTGVADSA